MSLSLDMPDFYPDCLEAGTLSYPAIASLLAGIYYLSEHFDELAKKNYALSKVLIDGLQTLNGYECFSRANACGIVAFRHISLQSEFLADALSTRYDIALRGGLHCAPLMHEALGTLDDGLLRASFSHFNSESDIERLLSALKELDER